jgi:hypothetical protein
MSYAPPNALQLRIALAEIEPAPSVRGVAAGFQKLMMA